MPELRQFTTYDLRDLLRKAEYPLPIVFNWQLHEQLPGDALGLVNAGHYVFDILFLEDCGPRENPYGHYFGDTGLSTLID